MLILLARVFTRSNALLLVSGVGFRTPCFKFQNTRFSKDFLNQNKLLIIQSKHELIWIVCTTAAIYIDWKFHNYITKSNRPSQTKTGVINLKRRKTSGGNLHSCLVCVFLNFLLKTEYVILGFPNNCKLLVSHWKYLILAAFHIT